MKFVFSLILMSSLTGCVGIQLERPGDIIDRPDFASVSNWEYRKAPPSRKADKINTDGSETFLVEEKSVWCGLTVWAIIPIPLWLPVCHNYTWATYKEGKPITSASQWVKTSGLICGPLVPILGIDDGGKSGFCRWDN